MQTPGRRAQTKLLCAFLQECIQIQLQQGGHCVLETRSSDIPIREEIMQGSTWLALLPHASHARGCALFYPRRVERCHGYHLIASFPVHTLRCHSTCREKTETPGIDVMQLYPAFVQHTLQHYSTAINSTAINSTAINSTAFNSTAINSTAINSATINSNSVNSAAPAPPASSMFPTEAALRAKQRIRAHQQATGDKPAIIHQRKYQEVHHDDCGDDFSSILDADLASLLFTKEAIPGPPLSVFRFQQARFAKFFAQNSHWDEDTYMALTCLRPYDFEAATAFEQHLHDVRLIAREHYLTMASSSNLSLWQPADHAL
eukprot:973936-Amphidinium_carterae.1